MEDPETEEYDQRVDEHDQRPHLGIEGAGEHPSERVRPRTSTLSAEDHPDAYPKECPTVEATEDSFLDKGLPSRPSLDEVREEGY